MQFIQQQFCPCWSDTLDIHKENHLKATEQVRKAKEKEYTAYYIYREAADTVLALNLPPTKWTNRQLKLLVLPLKQNTNGAMPTNNNKMMEAYINWKDHTPPPFDTILLPIPIITKGREETTNNDAEDDTNEAQQEVIQGLLDLADGNIENI